jgi:hypothetical protein
MNLIGLLKGHRKGLLVFYTNYLGYCISVESVIVVLLIEMQDLRDKLSFLELQPINLVIKVINKNSRAMGLICLVYKGNSDDIVPLLVRNLELSGRGEDDGCN